MNKRNLTILIAALLMIGGGALEINRMGTHQRLGKPGVMAVTVPGSDRLEIFLPEQILDYKSKVVPTDPKVLGALPQDTSFKMRRYSRDSRGPLDPLNLNVVVMGTDRTSIHKPQFCLRGNGWDIDADNSVYDTVRIDRPHPYDLPVMKILNTREVKDAQGNPQILRGIYVYWFVAENELTASHFTRMRKMATHLLLTGELQRWGYVSCFGMCLPGEEEATYARMKEFIATAWPQFYLPGHTPLPSVESSQQASR